MGTENQGVARAVFGGEMGKMEQDGMICHQMGPIFGAKKAWREGKRNVGREATPRVALANAPRGVGRQGSLCLSWHWVFRRVFL